MGNINKAVAKLSRKEDEVVTEEDTENTPLLPNDSAACSKRSRRSAFHEQVDETSSLPNDPLLESGAEVSQQLGRLKKSIWAEICRKTRGRFNSNSESSSPCDDPEPSTDDELVYTPLEYGSSPQRSSEHRSQCSRLSQEDISNPDNFFRFLDGIRARQVGESGKLRAPCLDKLGQGMPQLDGEVLIKVIETELYQDQIEEQEFEPSYPRHQPRFEGLSPLHEVVEPEISPESSSLPHSGSSQRHTFESLDGLVRKSVNNFIAIYKDFLPNPKWYWQKFFAWKNGYVAIQGSVEEDSSARHRSQYLSASEELINDIIHELSQQREDVSLGNHKSTEALNDCHTSSQAQDKNSICVEHNEDARSGVTAAQIDNVRFENSPPAPSFSYQFLLQESVCLDLPEEKERFIPSEYSFSSWMYHQEENQISKYDPIRDYPIFEGLEGLSNNGTDIYMKERYDAKPFYRYLQHPSSYQLCGRSQWLPPQYSSSSIEQQEDDDCQDIGSFLGEYLSDGYSSDECRDDNELRGNILDELRNGPLSLDYGLIHLMSFGSTEEILEHTRSRGKSRQWSSHY